MRFYGADFDRDLIRVQALRSDPPGEVGSRSHRRRVFGAALEQFDGLAKAAGAVPLPIAPILLFYALAQANQAVSAVRTSGNHWRPAGHGLTVKAPSDVLGEVVVSPDESEQSAFRLFCGAIGSPHLTGSVSLGELWAAVGMLRCVTGMGGEHRRCLRLITRGGDSAYFSGALATSLGHTNDEAQRVLTSRLRESYPGVADGVRVEEFGSANDEEPKALVSWVDDAEQRKEVADVLPPFLGSGGGTMVPPALATGDVLHPLAAWWAVLLGLSSVARYRPDLWRASLDRDSTPIAIAVEDGIAVTRELLPVIVMWAITGEGWAR